MKKEEKYIQYAKLLTSHIVEIFNEDCENHISNEELDEDDNLTHFIHALSTTMPNFFYNGFINGDLDSLEFNHVANKLIFQFGKMAD